MGNMPDYEDKVREEQGRLGAELREVTAERDALRAAIDAHVQRKVWQTKSGYWQAFDAGCELFCSRREAEAAYRKKTGLDVPPPATVARDDDGSPG
jgi:hypothetical protein